MFQSRFGGAYRQQKIEAVEIWDELATGFKRVKHTAAGMYRWHVHFVMQGDIKLRCGIPPSAERGIWDNQSHSSEILHAPQNPTVVKQRAFS